MPLSVVQGSTIDELNYLGKLLEMQGDEDKDKFTAAVTLGEHAGSVKDLINLAQNLDCYWIYPTVRTEATTAITSLTSWTNWSCPKKQRSISSMRNTGGTRFKKTGDSLPLKAISTTTATPFHSVQRAGK